MINTNSSPIAETDAFDTLSGPALPPQCTSLICIEENRLKWKLGEIVTLSTAATGVQNEMGSV